MLLYSDPNGKRMECRSDRSVARPHRDIRRWAHDIEVDGREAPIRAATGCPLGRERMPATESANAPSRSRLRLAMWRTPGFLRLAGIWANRLTFMSRGLR